MIVSKYAYILCTLFFRMDMAHTLGYQNYAQLSMETKMIGSIENVVNMLES